LLNAADGANIPIWLLRRTPPDRAPFGRADVQEVLALCE